MYPCLSVKHFSFFTLVFSPALAIVLLGDSSSCDTLSLLAKYSPSFYAATRVGFLITIAHLGAYSDRWMHSFIFKVREKQWTVLYTKPFVPC
ncbi:hypothetical protein BKA63DRAFT_517232 [Paraphoma chrysanthemicola]|nr:hypothetical protein BKA63DRAFT_517232 [Paraphoma chrysanthemicola]